MEGVEGFAHSFLSILRNGTAPVTLEFVTSLATQMHKGHNPVFLTA